MNEPKSDLARYAFGYSDKKPGAVFWIIHIGMIAFVLAIALGLAGCQSEQERRAEWITQCATQDFTAKQCEVLYSIAKDTRDAKNSAAAANFATGLSIGIATGR